jgi:hypothetical protein
MILKPAYAGFLFVAFGIDLLYLRMKKYLLTLSFVSVVAFFACNQNDNKKQTTTNTSQAQSDSVPCDNPETIKDPNDAKPMALMMRQMAANADSIKATLLRGSMPDSLRYPFIRFYLVEPTDPSVLEPQFYENARLFQQAYFAFFKHPNEAKKYYNVLIGKCVNCHENYCSGPLKRIRKLYIDL